LIDANSNKVLLPVREPETVSMRTTDGARLDADIYRPEGKGEYPVLLMRQPYGRRIASTVIYAHPSWYTANGYIVVIQDVRGRGTSEGRFRVFADDVRDGGDSIEWAARLPGSTGRVGMYGFSYQGHTQFLALAAGRPELRALCPGMATWNVHSDWAYEGGAFSFLNNLYWGIQMGAEQARLAGDVRAFEALYGASRALPLHSPNPCRPEVLETYGHYTHYGEWVANPEPGAYWESIAVGHALQTKPMDVPMLHIGGWYDFMLKGTLRAYREACTRSSKAQRLVIGPWTHMPWGRRAGAADFGPEAAGAIDGLQIAWFDRFLKDVDNGVDGAPKVSLFDLIAKTWRDFDDWPRPKPRAFFTSSDGLAAVSASGRLGELPPARAGLDVIVHDPWRPAPAVGGHNAEFGGMQERSDIDNRNDVLTYTTAPAEAPMTLSGEVELTLSVRADQPCFDVSAVLSRVTPDGRAFNLTQGHCRVKSPVDAPIRIGMRALCATLPAGDALRLSLAGANFPAFAVNPGTGAAPAEAQQIDNRVISLFVGSGGASPTRIELPIIT
jgi:putative CocE/NonD family hydrolase